MTNELKELLKKLNSKCVVYRTGSKLTHVNFNDSDNDFYAFTLPSKYEFVTGDKKGKTYHGENWEAKVFNASHLFNLLMKTNPNVVEMFFAKPVFVSPELGTFAKFVFQNREKLVTLNRKHFVASSAGMMKQNVSRMSKDKVFLGSGTFGKELYNFLKAYRYGKTVAKKLPLENEVFLTGEELEKMRTLKSLSTFSQEVLDETHVQEKFTELSDYADMLPVEQNEKLEHQLVDLLPLYY